MLCDELGQTQMLSQILTLCIALFISGLSSTSKTILKLISRFEMLVNFEDETKSRIIKMTILNTINAGLLISLISINFQFFGIGSEEA